MKVVHAPYLGQSNPYQDMLFEALEKNGIEVIKGCEFEHADIIHLHWINPLCLYDKLIPSVRDFIKLRSKLLRHKKSGKKIVWTVHNIMSHEGKHLYFERFVRKWLLRIVDVVLVHGPSAKEMLKKYFGNHISRIEVIYHPNYIEQYPNTTNRDEAKKQLHVQKDNFTFLFLGEIRPYKGVLELVELFLSNFAKEDGVRLVIAGRVKDSEYKYKLERLINSDTKIVFTPNFIDDSQISVYMNASDVVVFPYRRVLSSGAVMLAMSFGKACIAPNIGCIPDVLDDKGAFLYESGNEKYGMKEALLDSYNHRESLFDMGTHNYNKVKQWTWDTMAKQIVNIYNSIRT